MEKIIEDKKVRGFWVLFELSDWMWKLLRMKGKKDKSDTVSQMLTFSINERPGGQQKIIRAKGSKI